MSRVLSYKLVGKGSLREEHEELVVASLRAMMRRLPKLVILRPNVIFLDDNGTLPNKLHQTLNHTKRILHVKSRNIDHQIQFKIEPNNHPEISTKRLIPKTVAADLCQNLSSNSKK